MSNKIFRTKNGKCIDLGDNFEQANVYKDSIEKVFGESTYWITYTHKPVFSSRGEYLGYKTGDRFNTVE